MSGKTFLTPKELGAILGVSPSTVSRRIKDHTIPTMAFGGMLLIPASFIKDLEDRAMATMEPSKGPDGGSR
jgi:excisionase family DNA binding protein